MAKLSVTQRLLAWRRWVLKLELLQHILETKEMAKELLGKEVYLFAYSAVKTAAARERMDKETKIIDGQIRGKPLPRGEGRAEKEPEQCDHPHREMRTRGNGKSKWWICMSCKSRWERSEIPATPDSPPEGSERMMFGKYATMTYCQVCTLHPSYANWAINTCEEGEDPEPRLLRFAEYALNRETQQMDMDPEARTDPTKRQAEWHHLHDPDDSQEEDFSDRDL